MLERQPQAEDGKEESEVSHPKVDADSAELIVKDSEDDVVAEEDADIGGYEDEEYDDADVDDDSDHASTSPALLLLLMVGGLGIGMMLINITFTASAMMSDFAGDWAWVLVPIPLALFGAGAIGQYERQWLQQLGAATLGFALSQYLMFFIARQVLEQL